MVVQLGDLWNVAAATATGGEFEVITCSSPESVGVTVGTAATVTAAAAATGQIFRRCMSRRRPLSPLLKESFANSHRSGTTFLNP